jgi:hypothetical protein
LDRLLKSAAWLALCLVMAAGAYWAGTRSQSAAGRASAASAGSVALVASSAVEQRLERAGSDEELSAIRQAMLRAALAAPSASAPASRFQALDDNREVLDERMKRAPADPTTTPAVRRELSAAIAAGVGGRAEASFDCGKTICRVELTGGEGATLDQAAEALSDSLPKLFVSFQVYPTSDGRRFVYAATDPSALVLAPPSRSHLTTQPPH